MSPALQEDSLPTKPQGKPKNIGVDSLSLLQQIFPMQELNQGLLNCKRGINSMERNLAIFYQKFIHFLTHKFLFKKFAFDKY